VCFFKDKSGVQADSVEKCQKDTSSSAAAPADSSADATSIDKTDRQSQQHSAYGAWQTVQQEV